MDDTITPDELQHLLSGPDPPQVLDVRRAADRLSDPSMLPDAVWKDPEKVEEWAGDAGPGEVIIYCVRGGSVSRSVQEQLRKKDVAVRFVAGGLEAWRTAGKPVARRTS